MSDKLFGVLTSGTLEERDRQQLELFSAHTARQLPALADLVKQGLLACGRQPVERDTVLNWLGRLVSDLLSVEEVAAFMRELQVDTRESLEIIHRVHFELDRGAKSLGRATNAFRAALGRLMLLQASGFLYCDAGETTGGRSSERSSTLSVASPEGETIKAHEFVHEVRNFLNGVRLHSLLLSRFVTADEHLSEASEAVRAVDASIERISELLEGQHFGASSTGRARVSLRSLCARVVQNVSTRAEAAGVPFGAELELTEDLTGRDLDKLELVLLDLVQTAVENALESEGRVVLRARREREYAVIEVVEQALNTGAPLVRVARLADMAGLNAANSILADHGGCLRVTSEQGLTAFHITLPLGTQEEVVPQSQLERDTKGRSVPIV